MAPKSSGKIVKNSASPKAPRVGRTRKPQARSAETRRRLLAAARAIFVRDGYERAQIDAIAAAAGRTKGAVYGHFKDKEDLFLALFEERSKQDMEAVAARMGEGTDPGANLAAFRDYYRSLASDKSWAILTLEFKLHALRYPEVRRRLRRAYRQTRPPNLEGLVRTVFGVGPPDPRLRMEDCISALSPLLCALALESLLEPQRFSSARLPVFLETLFDALIRAEKLPP